MVNKHLRGERISSDEYVAASEVLGCSKRHIQRQIAVLPQGRELPRRARFQLTSFHKQVIIAAKGNVSLAYRRLDEAGHPLPDLDTFWRRWHEQPSGIQAYARRGAEGIIDFWLYPPYEAPERNTVWQADHFELPVDVIADGHRNLLIKPWLTLFEDDKTRMPMAWSLLAEPGRQPGAEEVCATIAEGIRLRLHNSVEVGGVPGIIRWDQALSFTAGMVTQMGAQVGFECHAVPPYSGWLKGKVERHPVLVVDEAQNLSYSWHQELRSMFDAARFTLVISGAEGAVTTLKRDSALWNRFCEKVFFEPLAGQELFSALAAFHPLLANTDPALLADIDAEDCHSVFRDWAHIVKLAAPLAAKSSTPDRLTPKVIRGVRALRQKEPGSRRRR